MNRGILEAMHTNLKAKARGYLTANGYRSTSEYGGQWAFLQDFGSDLGKTQEALGSSGEGILVGYETTVRNAGPSSGQGAKRFIRCCSGARTFRGPIT